jgi:hypothetical protein
MGATVFIKDISGSKGQIFKFNDSGNGKYIFAPNPSNGDTFSVGHSYTLVVIINGDTITGNASIHPTSRIDNFLFTNSSNGLGKFIYCFARDLVGVGNTYWVKTYRNDVFWNSMDSLNIAYDMNRDPISQDGGQFNSLISYDLINNSKHPWLKGDRAKVEIHSISLDAYYYLSKISDEYHNGGLFATPPINIGTNLRLLHGSNSGTSIRGFFDMSAVSVKKVTVP